LIAPAWIGGQPEATGEDGIRVVHIDLSGTVEDTASIASWLVERDADLILVAGVKSDQIVQAISEDSAYTLLSEPVVQAGVVIFGRDRWALETTRSEHGERVHLVTAPSGAGVINVVTTWGAMGASKPASDALVERFLEVTEVVENASDSVIVIGNLGATKWSAPFRSLIANTSLRDATEGEGYLPTAPISGLPILGRWMGIPIDVAYVGPDLTPLDLVVGPDIGAEHLPITIVVGPVQ
jgi:endonuclease/exonuclease/phosphatase (EEP) superfamily protein YafD